MHYFKSIFVLIYNRYGEESEMPFESLRPSNILNLCLISWCCFLKQWHQVISAVKNFRCWLEAWNLVIWDAWKVSVLRHPDLNSEIPQQGGRICRPHMESCLGFCSDTLIGVVQLNSPSWVPLCTCLCICAVWFQTSPERLRMKQNDSFLNAKPL